MARRPGRLVAAGFTQISSDAEGRRYRSPDGREVSYRQAFREARGEPLEAAVKNPGKFRDEFRIAERVRFLARERRLAETGAVDRADERAIGRSTLRSLTKGHYESEATRAGMRGRPPPDDAYGRVLKVLHAEPKASDVARSGMSEADIEAALKKAKAETNSPTGPKAHLLEALGFRDPGADYDVGETP